MRFTMIPKNKPAASDRMILLFLILGLTAAWAPAGVLDVTQYGADGSDSNDDTAAINSAIAALSSTGSNVLYFPAGTYLIDPATNSSVTADYVWVKGDGYGSVLKRLGAGGNGPLLKLDNLLGVRATHLRFDVNAAADADSGISANNATDVLIQDCTFINSGGYTAANAQNAAVKADNCPALWIVRNRVDGLMIDATSPSGGGPGVFIKDNYLTSVPYAAIIYRATGPNAIRACQISGNIVNGIRGTYGIQFGGLGGTDEGTDCNDIHVVENQIIGSWGASVTAISGGTTADQNKGWVIAKNIVHPDNNQNQNDTLAGIHIATGSEQKLDDLLLSGNVVKNMRGASISVSGRFQDVRIVGNHLGQTGGIQVGSQEGSSSGAARALVEANMCTASYGSGLSLRAVEGNLYAKVVCNTLRDSRGSRDGTRTGTSAGMVLETAHPRTLTAEVFQNEFSDTIGGRGLLTQQYGVKHLYGAGAGGTGSFRLRYFDNRFENNAQGAALDPPGDVEKRDNLGW